MRYEISYDLTQPESWPDYQRLYDALHRLGATRIMKSQWIVRHDSTSCVQLRDRLWSLMDANDRLFVVELDGTLWAGTGLLAQINDL